MQPSELQSTTSSSSSSQRDDLTHIETGSKLELLYPLYDQIIQFATLPSALVTLCAICTYLQIIFTALWANDTFYNQEIEYKDISDKFLKYGCWALWWIPKGTTFEQYRNSFIGCLIAVVIVAAFMIIIISNFSRTRKFIKWTLYPMNFFFTCLSQMMIHPLAALIGGGIKYGVVTGEALFYVFGVISVFIYAFNLFIYFIGLSFSSKSVYLHVS